MGKQHCDARLVPKNLAHAKQPAARQTTGSTGRVVIVACCSCLCLPSAVAHSVRTFNLAARNQRKPWHTQTPSVPFAEQPSLLSLRPGIGASHVSQNSPADMTVRYFFGRSLAHAAFTHHTPPALEEPSCEEAGQRAGWWQGEEGGLDGSRPLPQCRPASCRTAGTLAFPACFTRRRRMNSAAFVVCGCHLQICSLPVSDAVLLPGACPGGQAAATNCPPTVSTVRVMRNCTAPAICPKVLPFEYHNLAS